MVSHAGVLSAASEADVCSWAGTVGTPMKVIIPADGAAVFVASIWLADLGGTKGITSKGAGTRVLSVAGWAGRPGFASLSWSAARE